MGRESRRHLLAGFLGLMGDIIVPLLGIACLAIAIPICVWMVKTIGGFMWKFLGL